MVTVMLLSAADWTGREGVEVSGSSGVLLTRLNGVLGTTESITSVL